MSEMPRIFLEDVGELIFSDDGKNVWKVEGLTKLQDFSHLRLPPVIYVVDYPARGVGQRFLLGREICGPSKFHMLTKICHTMVRLAKGLGMFDGERIAQFIILYGGEAYNLHFADPPLLGGRMIDSTYIKYQRVKDESQPNGFRIERSAFSGQWWKDGVWIVHEECFASGETVKRFGVDGFKEHKPKKLFAFPSCGSLYGLQGIYKECEENGVELVPFFNCGLYDVAPVGLRLPYTDLGLRPLTITTREFSCALRQRYQGTGLCHVGDIGDSIHHVLRYLMETLDDMRLKGMDFSRENWHVWPEDIKREDFLERLAREFPEASRLLASIKISR